MTDERSVAGVLTGSALAGACVSFGVLLMSECRSEGLPTPLCGMAFSVGMLLAFACHGRLFMAEERTPDAMVAFATYVGNFVGVMAVAVLVSLSGYDNTTEVCDTGVRMGLSSTQCVVRGFMCNVVVCLSVRAQGSAKTTVGRLVACVLPMTCVSMLGWDHAVSDMFVACIGCATPCDYARVVAFVTVGNVAGSAFVSHAPSSIRRWCEQSQSLTGMKGW